MPIRETQVNYQASSIFYQCFNIIPAQFTQSYNDLFTKPGRRNGITFEMKRAYENIN